MRPLPAPRPGLRFALLTAADRLKLAALNWLDGPAFDLPRAPGLSVGVFVENRLEAALALRPVPDRPGAADIFGLSVPGLPRLLAEGLVAEAARQAQRRGWLRLRWPGRPPRDPWRQPLSRLGPMLAVGADLWLRVEPRGEDVS